MNIDHFNLNNFKQFFFTKFLYNRGYFDILYNYQIIQLSFLSRNLLLFVDKGVLEYFGAYNLLNKLFNIIINISFDFKGQLKKLYIFIVSILFILYLCASLDTLFNILFLSFFLTITLFLIFFNSKVKIRYFIQIPLTFAEFTDSSILYNNSGMSSINFFYIMPEILSIFGLIMILLYICVTRNTGFNDESAF